MFLAPGSLDRCITIKRRAAATDADYGTEPDGPWITVLARIAANLQDLLPSKSESVKDGLRLETRRTRVRIRYRPGITADLRVVIHESEGDRITEIVAGPVELGRRDGLEMVVEEYSS